MAHFVGDDGQEIDTLRGFASGRRQQPVLPARAVLFACLGRLVDEPSESGGIVVDHDAAEIVKGKRVVTEVADLEGETVEHGCAVYETAVGPHAGRHFGEGLGLVKGQRSLGAGPLVR